jgi:hypothetical protein
MLFAIRLSPLTSGSQSIAEQPCVPWVPNLLVRGAFVVMSGLSLASVKAPERGGCYANAGFSRSGVKGNSSITLDLGHADARSRDDDAEMAGWRGRPKGSMVGPGPVRSNAR